MARKVDSKEVGLEIGFLTFKFFLKSEYLHYGYFNNDLKADIENLKEAQSRYADLLFSHIPDRVRTILEVGCGSGKMAKDLVEKGYDIDCVSPSALLNNYAEEMLDGNGKVHLSKFENFETSKTYDLILFVESFQYIPIEESIPRALKYLNKGGYIILVDFFRRDIPGRHPIGGGHDFVKWEKLLENFPVDVVFEKDITEETSKTIDVVNQFTNEVIHPVWRSSFALAEDRFPLFMKLIKWKYKKKFAKMEKKHFSGQRHGENFKKYKIYMLYLLKSKT